MTTRYNAHDWDATVPADAVLSEARLNNIEQGIKAYPPVGWIEFVVWIDQTNPPPGALFCDGSTISKTTYAELWAFVQANPGQVVFTDLGGDDLQLPNYNDGYFGRGMPPANVGTTGGSATHVHTNPTTATGGAHIHTNPNVNSGGAHVHTVAAAQLASSGFEQGTDAPTEGHVHNTNSGGSHAHSQGSTGSGRVTHGLRKEPWSSHQGPRPTTTRSV